MWTTTYDLEGHIDARRQHIRGHLAGRCVGQSHQQKEW